MHVPYLSFSLIYNFTLCMRIHLLHHALPQILIDYLRQEKKDLGEKCMINLQIKIHLRINDLTGTRVRVSVLRRTDS